MRRSPWKILAFVAAGIVYCAVLFLLSQAALTYLPNTGDENSGLFQAKIFGKGSLTAPEPPFSRLLSSHYIDVSRGTWFSAYPPGHSLFLMFGVWSGYPLAASFLISFAIAVLLFNFVRTNYRDLELAWMTTILFVLSPTFLFHSVSYYSHLSSCLVFVASLNLIHHRHSRPMILFGLLVMLGILIRPFTFFVLAFPLAGYLLRTSENGERRVLFWPLTMAALGALIFWAYEADLSGALFDLPYLRAGENAHKFLNFQPGAFSRIAHMLNDTIKWAMPFGFFRSGNLKIVNVGDLELYLLIIALAAIAWIVRQSSDEKRSREIDYLLMSCFLALVVGHFFYGAQGGRFGERYFFEAAFVIPLLTGRALLDLRKLLSRRVKRYAPFVITALLLAPGIIVYIPGTVRFFHRSNLVRMDIYLQARAMNLHDALIFIRDVPEFDPAFFARNDPFLEGNIFARASDPDTEAELTRTFGDRARFEYVRQGNHFVLQGYNSP